MINDEIKEKKEPKQSASLPDVPPDWPVQPIPADTPGATICGGCGRAWNDEIVTGMTPTPSGRCPFEPFHRHEPERVYPVKKPTRKRSGLHSDKAIKLKDRAIGWIKALYRDTFSLRRSETEHLAAYEDVCSQTAQLKLPRWAEGEVVGYEKAMFDRMFSEWFEIWHCEAGVWKPSKEVNEHSQVDKSARVWKGTRKVFNAWTVKETKQRRLTEIKEV